MKCPICKNSDLKMSDRQGIEIDYCPDCRGVWLDRGELDKIIERTNNVNNFTEESQSPKYSNNDVYSKYDDKHYKHKKRKSLLGEIFDF